VPRKQDGKFPQIPFASNPNGQPLLMYDEFWERDTRDTFYMVNRKDNTRVEFKNDTKKADAEAFINDMNRFAQNEMVKLVVKPKATVNLYSMIEGEVFYHGRDPNGIDEYPFTPFIATHTPEYDDDSISLQSFIRPARDPQKELNKRISKTLDIMDSRMYGGHYAKLSKLVDQDDLYNNTNSGNIGLTDDAVIGQDIAPIQLPDVPSSLFQMANVFDENVMSTLNLNDSAFGAAASSNTSALQTMVQQSSAMMGIQPTYDNLNRSQNILTCKLMKMIQTWSDKKIEKISKKPPTALFRDKDFTKWEVVCSQGVLTEHQKKMQFAQLVELKSMGVEEITGLMLLKRAPIQDKSSFLKEIEENQKAQAEQQQKIEEKMAVQEELAMKLANAKVISDLSLAEERKARAKADVGLLIERTSESVQNQSQAVLNQVKAASEIQGMRQDQAMSAIDFVLALQERASGEEIQKEVMSTAIAETANETPTPQQQPQQQQLATV